MVNLQTVLLGIAALAGTALLWFVLATYDDSETLLERAIGFTAGLQGAQVAKVHLFTIACVLYVVFGRKAVPGRVPRNLLLAAAVGCLVLSAPLGTLVNSDTLALQIVALALSGIVVASRVTATTAKQMLYGLLAATVLGAFVAIGQKAGAFPYTAVIDASGIPRVKGIYHEPDWLGLYTALGILLVFLLPLRRHVQALSAACLIGASILSGARASWLALAIISVVGLTTHVARPGRHRTALRNGRMLLLAAVLLPAIAIFSPGVVSTITNRLDGSQASQVSVVAREDQDAALEELARVAPWHGLGLSASGHVSVSGAIIVGPSPNNVATNWILGWWVDAKYLAVPIIVLLIGLALRTATNTSGLLLGVVLIDSLFANAVLNPILWFLVGLALSDLPTSARTVPRYALARVPSRRPGAHPA